VAWIMRLLARRSRQSALTRWLEATAIFGIALALRVSLGPLHGAVPFLSFYPAILISALLFGWKEAAYVLLLSLFAGWRFFLPPDMVLLPLGWALVGGLNIAIIIGLGALAEQLAEANERQRLLFAELQHRVANTLQTAAGKLERLKRTMISNGADDHAELLDEAIQRILASADIHRRLHDPVLFGRGIKAMLTEVLGTVFDQPTVTVDLQVEELPLSLDQKSVIAMLVIELANNSAKHVFERNLGSYFGVRLTVLPVRRARLKVEDDGPGLTAAADTARPGRQLGTRIVQGLVEQLHGTLTTQPGAGSKVIVDFPMHQRVAPGA
jgi:two-component sensor histidine kinase